MDGDTPVLFEPMSANSVNNWFDHWKSRSPDRNHESIDKLRKLALYGASKARRNKAVLCKAVVAELRQIADAVEASMTDEA
jgi:hypothetical protein